MKFPAFFLALALPLTAMPPAVGTLSDDVVFAEGLDYSGRNFGTLQDTSLTALPNTVQVFYYFAPW